MVRRRKPSVWPWARDNMTPDERREVIAYSYDHPDEAIVVGYSPRIRRFFANVGPRRAEAATPIEAFRAATVEIVGLMS